MKIGLENSGQPRQPTSANFPTKKFVLVWQYSVNTPLSGPVLHGLSLGVILVVVSVGTKNLSEWLKAFNSQSEASIL